MKGAYHAHDNAGVHVAEPLSDIVSKFSARHSVYIQRLLQDYLFLPELNRFFSLCLSRMSSTPIYEIVQSGKDTRATITLDAAVFAPQSTQQSLLTPRPEISASTAPSQLLPEPWSYRLFDLKGLFHYDNLHGHSPLAMLFCLTFAGLLAVCHHFFYNHLDTTIVQTKNKQEWALRFGNAFALATKTALGVAVGIAYTQQIWTTFKQKSITVEGIDAITTAPNDIFALFNREMWLRNLSGTTIAVLLW